MPTKPVSIIIPWIRKEKFERCIGCLISLWDLPETYEIVAEEDKERIGCPKMVKKLTDQTKYDLVMFLGDDTVPRAGIFHNTVKAMKQFEGEWGLVGINDGFHNGKHHATHWLAHKKLLPHLDGEFFHTGYWHCFCDNELIMRCKELDRYVFAMEARLLHDNPIVLRSALDDDPDYKRVYSVKWMQHDKWLFIRRRNNGWHSNSG